VSLKMSFFDFEQHRVSQELRRIHFLHAGKKRCPKCDLYSCICQTALREFGFENNKVVTEVSHAQKVRGCPQKCLNSSKECLECYDFDKFKTEVKV
jgi:hypothetical protein